MSVIKKNTVILLALSLMAALSSACNQDNKTTQTIIKQSNFVAATVKPHANIFMQYSLPDIIEPAQPVTVSITVLSGQAADELTLKLHLGEGLSSADVLHYKYGAQLRGQKNTFNIVVQADTNGEYRIHLDATLKSKQSLQSRSFIVPLKIGKTNQSVQFKANGVFQDETSEKIISMPAKEISY